MCDRHRTLPEIVADLATASAISPGEALEIVRGVYARPSGVDDVPSGRDPYFLTFGKRGLRDGYVVVFARDYEEARAWVLDEYGTDWSFLYPEEEFRPGYFPSGAHGIVIV